ncbi:non-ribosomal peptide synthetase [Actinophytocola sp.]|uniref:non-ribosomal peptide synthetase n=1 Tax=Actinophytocola sp. TaxID=1872138 RepID=UPI003D6C631B
MCTTIVEALQHWIRATPGATAIEGAGAELTYATLGRRAAALARTLVDAGLTRGGVVALALDDPVEVVVGMVATVTGGGAYLVLGNGLPVERLRLLVEESRPQVVVTRGQFPVAGVPRIGPDDLTAGSTPVRETDLAPDDVACVFFTSGSTGRPKGVPLEHAGVTRLFTGDPPMDLAPGTRMAQSAYLMFDAATLEIWGPLLQGGTMVCLPQFALLDPARLPALLQARRIGALFVPTTLFRQIAAREPGAFASLDALYVGGEALDAGSVNAVLRAGPPRRFRNLYGPTETTTLATWQELTGPRHDDAVPIGRAVPATGVYLLDERMLPVPPGEVGEIWVGGRGVGRGYLGRPGLTAARFRPDPYAEQQGGRLYRTGDQARAMPDGTLVFTGRKDRQVKIDGFRIELEEIEAVLATHPRVSGAAVEVALRPGGQRHLVAYLAAPADLDTEEIRAHAAERLPRYMVPPVLMTMARLPVTASGKVDRARLAAPRPEVHRAGSTALSDTVAAAWCTVLGLSEVDRSRNFFDVGGTSLLLIELRASLAEAFGAAPELRELVAHPTVEAQAALMAGGTHSTAAAAEEVTPRRDRLRRRRANLTGPRGAHA